MLRIESESNIEVLRQACFAYRKAVDQLIAKVTELGQRVAQLEGIDAAQLAMDLPDVDYYEKATSAPNDSLSPEPTPKPESRKPQRGHGPTAQPDLPIVPTIHAFDRLPSCDVCGGDMEAMEGQFEDAEEITVEEKVFTISLHRRQKYRCRCNANVVTAPGPPKLIPGGRYSIEFAVHTAIAKYCDHMPLERQVRQLARHGLEMTSQTLWDQLDALAGHLEPTYLEIWHRLLQEPVLHVDETGWKFLSNPKSKWTVWGMTAPGLACYRLLGSKSVQAAKKVLKDYTGILVVDGFAVYPALARARPDLRIAHCWAHADRKFKDAKDPPELIREIRSRIAKLYEIEREVEGPFPGDDSAQAKRFALRQEKSRPVIEEMREWAFAQGGLRRSNFGRALRYLLKYWDGLTLFLDHPRIPLDNNAAERALRGVVVGRKNHYGSRSRRGTVVAAILYSLVETAKLAGANPQAYLQKAAFAAIRRPGTVILPS